MPSCNIVTLFLYTTMYAFEEIGEHHRRRAGNAVGHVGDLRGDQKTSTTPADSGSSICSRGVDPAWFALLRGLSRLMMSQ